MRVRNFRGRDWVLYEGDWYSTNDKGERACWIGRSWASVIQYTDLMMGAAA